jgi:hypothetical protein
MQLTPNSYILQWKGRESGPFTVEEIKAKLDSNEIGLLHSVRDQSGAIVTLEELMAAVTANEMAEQQRQQERRAQQEQERIQADYEERLAAEESKQQELQKRLTEVEGKILPTHPLAPSPSPSGPRESQHHEFAGNYAPERTSGLAVTALVMGLLNFVPFVNFVSWILAIIFGHIALSQINRDPNLKGRGMAVAGLTITYVLLGIGVVFGIVFVSNRRF